MPKRKALVDDDAVRDTRGRFGAYGEEPPRRSVTRGSFMVFRDSPLLRAIDAAATRLEARVPALIPIGQLCATEAASVAQPPMSPAALAILVSRADELGYQRDKNRGTAQGPLLDAWAKLDDALGEWLRSVFTWAGEKGAIINVFLNVNGGGIVDVDGSSKTGWHTDKPTEGRKGVTNNGRIVLYYMNGSGGAGDACGTLSVRKGGREQTMIMQRGTALVATNELLTAQGVEHKHAGEWGGVGLCPRVGLLSCHPQQRWAAASPSSSRWSSRRAPSPPRRPPTSPPRTPRSCRCSSSRPSPSGRPRRSSSAPTASTGRWAS